jgi:hypothetical protein
MGRVLPILFNTDMVRAILDGRKTVTRRVVRYKYNNTEMKMRTDKYGTRLIEIQKDIEGETHGKNPDGSTWHKLLPYIEKNPPYKKGDILYVRETYCPNYFDFVAQSGNKHGYKADYDSAILSSDIPEPKWIPSIHMPKEAARIWLRVTDVGAERLRDMDKMDAVKEGINTRCCVNLAHALTKFKKLWDSTIRRSDTGLYGWKSNPWVWVIEFERCEKPDDI